VVELVLDADRGLGVVVGEAVDDDPPQPTNLRRGEAGAGGVEEDLGLVSDLGFETGTELGDRVRIGGGEAAALGLVHDGADWQLICRGEDVTLRAERLDSATAVEVLSRRHSPTPGFDALAAWEELGPTFRGDFLSHSDSF
jgi:hypothetical protein